MIKIKNKISKWFFRIEPDMEIKFLIKRGGPADFNFEFAESGFFGPFGILEADVVGDYE